MGFGNLLEMISTLVLVEAFVCRVCERGIM